MAASDAAQNIALEITSSDHSTIYKNQDQMSIAIDGSTGKGVFPLAAAYIRPGVEQRWVNLSLLYS